MTYRYFINAYSTEYCDLDLETCDENGELTDSVQYLCENKTLIYCFDYIQRNTPDGAACEIVIRDVHNKSGCGLIVSRILPILEVDR